MLPRVWSAVIERFQNRTEIYQQRKIPQNKKSGKGYQVQRLDYRGLYGIQGKNYSGKIGSKSSVRIQKAVHLRFHPLPEPLKTSAG